MVRLLREVMDVVEGEHLQCIEVFVVLKQHPDDVGEGEDVKGSEEQCEEEIFGLEHSIKNQAQ